VNRCQEFIQAANRNDPHLSVEVHDVGSHGVFMVKFPTRLARTYHSLRNHLEEKGELVNHVLPPLCRRCQSVLAAFWGDLILP